MSTRSTRAEYSQALGPETETLSEGDLHEREQHALALEKLILDHLGVLPRERQKTDLQHVPSRKEEKLEFRLISGSRPTIISLAPRVFIYAPIERLSEDTPEQESRRRLIAQETAVDGHLVIAQRDTAINNSPSRANVTTETYTTDLSSPDPHIFVLDISVRIPGEETKKPLPRCQMVKAITPSPAIPDNIKRRRRHRKSRNNSEATHRRSPPHFFIPDPSWGGKTAGYALGWKSPWSSQERYVSLQMNQGVEQGHEGWDPYERVKRRGKKPIGRKARRAATMERVFTIK